MNHRRTVRLSFLLLSFFSFYTAMAQKKFNYDSTWLKVEAFKDKGLPKSALQTIKIIYAKAKAEKNEVQQIKAVVNQGQLVMQVEENQWAKNIDSLDAETSKATEPVRQVLNSIMADLYYSYFQNQRYKIYQRTNTANFTKNDPETWTVADFHTKIAALYEASLSNPKLLQQTKLDPFDPVITKGNVRNLRPTLYDLLAWKALEYFKSDESDVTKPAYAFELNDAASLSATNTFIKYKYDSKDTSSHALKAIGIYQQLLSFHINDNDKAAFLDADIDRIQYAYSKSVFVNKEQLYKDILEQLFMNYKNEPGAMEAGYLEAIWWYNKASNYKPGIGKGEEKYMMKLAVEMLKAIVKKFPNSEGGIHAATFLPGLLNPTIDMQVEKVNLPNLPFRSLVKYKNADQVNLRVIKITDEIQKGIDNSDFGDNDKYWAYMKSLPTLKTWKQALPEQDDYRQHSAEIKLDGLPIGKYAVLGSLSPNFGTLQNAMAVSYVYVSNISFVHSGSDYYILDRDNGQPLAGAKAQVWYREYDYNTRKYIRNKSELKTADANGYIKLTEDKQGRSVALEVHYKDDVLFTDDDMYIGRSESYSSNTVNNTAATPSQFEKNNLRYFFFSDRSIYRPGQWVYFKAIGVTKDMVSKKSKLYLPAADVEVILNNANGVKVESQKLSTNEYGSITGKFRLPENVLNGQFYLNIDDRFQYSFRVEEYKRPKFYVEYEKVKGSYRINEKIKVTGVAKAYAGNNVDGASVTYRVFRNTRYLYPWVFWSRGIWPPAAGGKMEITHGEATTDSLGKFIVEFEAIPDLSVSRDLDPTFDYTIEADVADINGETRSGTTNVTVGYKALQLSLSIAGGTSLPTDSLNALSIITQNLNGEFEPTKTDVKIYELKGSDRLLRKRYWEVPDTSVMNYNDFVANFPNDPYKKEDDYRTWDKGGLKFSDTFTTKAGSKLPITAKGLSAGWYAVEVTAKDKYGEEVKAIEYVQLYDLKSNKLPSKQYQWDFTIKGSGEPGEKAVFVTGTSADNLFVVQETVKPDESGNSDKKETSKVEYIKTGKQLSTVELPITEADRGSYAINRFFVKNNRFYTNQWQITVPWTNKDLDISFETFRDKLLPGQEEKWTVKIKGYKGDKAAAEMLASMYDASLDQFNPHSWKPLDVWPTFNFYNRWEGTTSFTQINANARGWWPESGRYFDKRYDELISIQRNNYYRGGKRGEVFTARYGDVSDGLQGRNGLIMDSKVSLEQINAKPSAAPLVYEYSREDDNITKKLEAGNVSFAPNSTEDFSAVSVRTNLQETAFFFPDLHTDENGNISFSFTIPEALTQWKLQTLAHTKELASGMATKTIVTQKDLMVQPNAPRFFREGDKLELSTKIVNLTDKPMTGQVQLLLFDAATNQSVDGLFKNSISLQNFTAAAGQSTAAKFPIEIPMNFGSALTYRIVAKSGAVSDGEESAAPVLTNRMLVTETLPLNMRSADNKNFTFDKLLNNTSTTLTQHALTVEYTSNPVWYAVQSLPYLMDYPYECAEQTFSRFYANALATTIANKFPKIRSIFEQWKTQDTAALMSNLEKNQELKSALLEETPWVMDAQNESKQKKNIALLFDLVKMSAEAEKAMSKLKELQTPQGGFVWFKGGPDDRYMTQYILTSMGHLRKLDAWPASQKENLTAIAAKAMPYLDARIKEDYDWLIRYKNDLKANNLSSIAIQYLYMRSFFTEYPIAPASKIAVDYYTGQAQKFWLKTGKYEQGMIALALNRKGDAQTPVAIIKSLKENSIVSEEFGRYWKEFNTGGYYWYQAPIESHSLLIEAFTEIDKNQETISDLKTWLLKQKQTQNWRSTKATAEACYALLLQGNNWLNVEKTVTIKLGDYTVSSNDANVRAEAGTGYFKQRIDGDKVKPNMGKISVSVTNPAGNKATAGPTTSWGAVYWQYFENLDKITTAATPLALTKKLFVEKNTDRGPVLTPVNAGDVIKVGDKIKVRIELRVDRNLEYVHMKDMRAACMEPVNVLSTYKYQDGLGYYESTKDASTNFFFSYLNKGTYVFEYPLFVTTSGNFSNGITSIQCMYAPEFTSHSEGIRVTVK